MQTNVPQQPPIEDYGIIGDTHTCALISTDGSCDFLCYPYFDSPSVFCSLLDPSQGGFFRISPVVPSQGCYKTKQLYLFNTNVLLTRIFCDGLAEITDFFSMNFKDPEWRQFYRIVKSVRGTMDFKMECRPRFNYGRTQHEIKMEESSAHFVPQNDNYCLKLYSTAPLQSTDGDAVESRFTLREGESACFVLMSHNYSCRDFEFKLSCELAEEAKKNTLDYWHNWLKRIRYQGRWRETIIRSALTLKLLTFAPTGAVIAAPTFSLPEKIGGNRNFDYRYVWIRDSAFVIYSFIRLGFTEEADAFMCYLEKIIDKQDNGQLLPVYDIWGREIPDEQELTHWSGYMGSRPVRIGNACKDQFQLDIYVLLDSIYLSNKYATQISYERWSKVKKLCDYVVENWKLPDHGIWEPRTNPRHHTYSKICCWIALDRAIRLGDKRSLPYPVHYKQVRDQIYEEIQTRGYHHERKSYVSHYDGENLDAAVLLAPLTFFCAANDPRMLSTIDAIMKSPCEGGLFTDGLVFRYNQGEVKDGFDREEGTFCLTSFWLVEALARSAQHDKEKLHRARLIFEKAISFGNHLALLSEVCLVLI
ncbi:hypothetical protein RCL1_004977 [Eukaryota sp. TZLM3-RCL]